MNNSFKNIFSNYILTEETFNNISDEVMSIAKAMSDKIENQERIIFVCVGSSASIVRGMANDLEFNFNIPREKIIINEAGRQYKEFMNDWKEVGSMQSVAALELGELDIKENELIIFISSSGETSYIVGGINFANDCNANTVLITNNDSDNLKAIPKKTIALTYDKTITNVRSLEATTLMKVLLDLVVWAAVIESGRVYNNQLVYQKWNSKGSREWVLNSIINATGKKEEEVIKALDESKWVSEIATTILLTGLNEEQAKMKLERFKGNISKLSESL